MTARLRQPASLINRLKEKNFLKRIGPDRGGHWKVLD
jgi:hypothetical protein